MADYSLSELARSGIYQIVNTINGKRYVGSAVRLDKRWYEHRRDLSLKRHHCISLQRAWDKYGGEAFLFSVVEFCDKNSLIENEQRHIDERAEYNVCRVAGSTLGIKYGEDVRQKLRQARAKTMAQPGWVPPTKGLKYSREICERMAAPKRGRKRPPRSPEWCQKIADAKTGKSVGKGRAVSEATRLKIAETLRGRKRPIEDRKRDPRLSIDDETVLKVINLRVSGLSYSRIADETGVEWHQVQRICQRKRYEWVAPDIDIPAFRSTGWKVVGRRKGVIRN